VTPQDVRALMVFYEQGSSDGGFEAGIEAGLERMLVDPEFLFRVESDRLDTSGRPFQITDLELSSRLSFFLWSSIPDDTLLDLAEHGKLRAPGVLEAQVRRMLADPRASRSLVDNFAGQWLVIRNVDSITPSTDLFHEFDENLRSAMKKETELFVEHQLRADNGIPELLSAKYSFLNERLARHYGIPNVYGDAFRRVDLEGTPHVVSRPHVAGPAWQGAAREHARHPAPAASPERADAEGQGRRRAAGIGSRSAGGAQKESGLHLMPSADGPPGLLARKLRCHWDLAQPRGGRRARGRVRCAYRWDEVRRPARTATAPAVEARPIRGDRDGEAAVLRTRAHGRILRQAHRSSDRPQHRR
jgi:hypothetical protein